MNLIDTNTVDQEIDPSGFALISDDKYPLCLIGFKINDKYDHLRRHLGKDFKSNDYIHFVHQPDVYPLFFRGVAFNLHPSFKNLINDLNELNTGLNYTVDRYKQILKKYDLHCNNCAAHIAPGVHPIDGECITLLSKEHISVTKMYENIFSSEDIPYFQSVGYITIFILSNKNIANSSNYKALKQIVENYKKSISGN
jgi:hypothetical protein